MIGQTIAHYKILEKLGQGGMGVVYKAHDTKLNRTVALKFTPPGALETEEDKARFRGEAQAAAGLDHPNICTIYEINEADGETFIAMKFISGRELRDAVREGPMDITTAVDVAAQVATALQEAHDNDIVHRDIKSANVMLTDKGRAIVMDFGLAKQLGRVQITKAGTSLGTIDYMSPEQAAGLPVDHRTDIWSLGVMLYEMAAGRLPFKGEFDQAVIYSIINQDHEPLSAARKDAPDELSRIVDKAMAKKPDDRYQTALEMLDDLNALLAGMGAPVTSPSRVTSSVARPPSSVSPPGGLFNGRTFIIAVIYAVAALALYAFSTFLVNRFPLSPHLPNFVLIALGAMLPSVLLLGMRRKPGGVGSLRVGIPLNVVAAAAVLFFAFQGKDLGAATTTVVVPDEAGNTIERVVPKSEFRKRLAMFYFDNKSGDPAEDWVQYGVIHALRYDLYQDLFISVTWGFGIGMERAGFKDETGAPITLKRKLAGERHYEFFIAGDYTKNNGVYQFNVTLYDTDKGSKLSEFTYESASVFDAVDRMSVDLRKGMGVPQYHIDESVDLSVADLLTSSPAALMNYTLARNATEIDNDYVKGVGYLEAAVDDDPSFASAHWSLCGVYFALSRSEEGLAAIDMAMEHRYKLPEQIQFNLRNSYYNVNEQKAERFENAKRWATLYPQDAIAHVVLSGCYEELRDFDAAIGKRKDALAIEPNRYDELRQIARLYETKGDWQQALDYRQQYAELFPDQYESFTEMARLYRMVGEFEQARETYKQALVVEPNNVEILTQLAMIEQSTGNFDEAVAYCEEALASARTAPDSSTALATMQQHYLFRGQGRDAIAVYEQNLDVFSRYQHPVNMMFIRLFSVGLYVMANDPDRAFKEIREIESGDVIPQLRPIIGAGYLITYAMIDDPKYLEETKQKTAEFEAWVNAAQREDLRWVVDMCRGGTLRWEENWEAALEAYLKALETMPQNQVESVTIMYAMAAYCSLQLGRLEAGIAYGEQGLAIEPYSPIIHMMMASLYDEMGDKQRARSHLDKGLYVYDVADEDFLYYQFLKEITADIE